MFPGPGLGQYHDGLPAHTHFHNMFIVPGHFRGPANLGCRACNDGLAMANCQWVAGLTRAYVEHSGVLNIPLHLGALASRRIGSSLPVTHAIGLGEDVRMHIPIAHGPS